MIDIIIAKIAQLSGILGLGYTAYLSYTMFLSEEAYFNPILAGIPLTIFMLSIVTFVTGTIAEKQEG